MNTLLKKTVGRSSLVLSSLALLALSQTAPAAILITVSDDGTDLTMTFSGSLDTSGDGAGGASSDNFDFLTAASSSFLITDGTNFSLGGAGTLAGSDPVINSGLTNFPSMGTGTGFGFNGSQLIWDDSFGANPNLIAPTGSTVFSGATVASVFGTNLNGGPVVLWNHTSSGDTISIGAATSVVPEPSSLMLCSLGGLALFSRRRRKS